MRDTGRTSASFHAKFVHRCRLYMAAALFPVIALAQGQPVASNAGPPHMKIVLVGDSTVATGGGWGPGFCAHVKPGIDCLDLAVNGSSTKSFADRGTWDKAIAEHGQFYFIQFGHNDQKDMPFLHTDPQTTFKQNLHRFITDVRNIGGTPILVTSLSRRNYDGTTLIVDPLHDYAAATREQGTEDHVPVIDLYQMSVAMLTPMTQAQADRYDATVHADAKAEGATPTTPDRTHLNDLGKATFGDMVASAAYRQIPTLREYMTPPEERQAK
jgi:lysophospholipase L1-like esterase